MTYLAGWRQNLQNLFGEFTMAVSDLIRQLPHMQEDKAKQELEKFHDELAKGVDELSNAKQVYASVVEAYLKQFPPAFSNELTNNLREYDKLVAFSLRIGNKELLAKWGIDYPRRKGFNWIDQENEQYIEKFEALRDRTPGASEYFNYLINLFK